MPSTKMLQRYLFFLVDEIMFLIHGAVEILSEHAVIVNYGPRIY